MALNNFRLLTLGRLDLLAPTGAQADPSLSSRRRKIALLVLLASARRPVSKDTLVEMFWGEQDEARARHSLSDALSHLRRVLGRTSIVANHATAAIDPSTSLAIDSVEFATAVKDGNDGLALELHAGPFLEGVHVDGSSGFESWVSAERLRLCSLFGRACARRAEALFKQELWDDCAEVARKWLDSEPASSAAAKFRLQAMAAPGSREAAVRALQEFERITARLNTELGLRPDAAVAAIARDLARQVREDELPSGRTSEFAIVTTRPVSPPPAIISAAAPVEPAGTSTATGSATASAAASSVAASSVAASVVAASPVAASSVAASPVAASPATTSSISAIPATASSASAGTIPTITASTAANVEIAEPITATSAKPTSATRPRLSRLLIAATALVAATAGAVSYGFRNKAAPATATRTVVALTDFEWANGDSAGSWMADGLATMLASRLSRSPAMELISPDRVREIARRAQYPQNEPLGTERSRDIGMRSGANWVVSGALAGADTALRLELTVRDVKTDRVLRVSSVAARDVLSLADAAAALLLDVVDPAGSGARLTDLETSSQEAYQHFVAYVRYSGGVSHTLAQAELDKALALDSTFISAIIERRRIAYGDRDSVLMARLDTLFNKHKARATFWDRTTLEAERIFPLGEVGRTLALYRELVARYPRDPRAYTRLWNTLTLNGNWEEAERVAQQQLAIDSLAATAGNGVCAPCGAYSDLAHTRLALGDAQGAENAARRLLELQPDLGGAHALLTEVLMAAGKYDEGLEAYRRARVLNPEDVEMWTNGQARHLIIARRLPEAETLIKELERSKNPVARDLGLEVRSLWLREQGKWKESLAIIAQMEREGTDKRQARLMRGNTLARMGDYAGARQAFETLHELFEHDLRGDRARWFAWMHTVMGDALAPTGDTVLLKTLADSVALISTNSYYARDKMMPHYLRGLVAVRGNRTDEAEREFRQALFSRNGFTRVNMELARLLARQERYKEAEELLLQALMGPLDAMPRYQPRSEVHALLDSVRRVMKQ